MSRYRPTTHPHVSVENPRMRTTLIDLFPLVLILSKSHAARLLCLSRGDLRSVNVEAPMNVAVSTHCREAGLPQSRVGESTNLDQALQGIEFSPSRAV